MPTYSILQIYEAARSAGFTPQQATTWTAIAMAESGGRVDAHNPDGEDSRGLWQINLNAHDDKWGDLYDPYNNARAAYEVSHQGTDMRPWTTAHTGSTGEAAYFQYLDDVEAVTGVQGDHRGVESYSSPLPPPLPTTATTDQVALPQPDPYDQIDHGHSPGAHRDADDDGLT